jgi:hypothetical protein
MKVIIGIISSLLVLAVFASAQVSGDCPSITIKSPVEIVPMGEFIEYIVSVDTKGKSLPLRFEWSTSVGSVDDGQGTTKVRVKRQSDSMTVTVRVFGLPPGCPDKAAESFDVLPAPRASKLYEWNPTVKFEEEELTRIADTMKINPSSGLHILSGWLKGKQTSSAKRREAQAIDFLLRRGIAKDQITFTGVYSELEVLQFWLVPPGADRPECDDCVKGRIKYPGSGNSPKPN